ncbi:transglutaminase-like domain-containing protein [Tenacibaculum jejuense]|uniref:transglutaminase-like domain-containing protein n=1 Tax=Tenacibaculum jejuense TaxID=584609 RepID=UPI0012FD3EF3|nr:transglutaminase-like domain-containing protein [Tenacibaculum jejuense]
MKKILNALILLLFILCNFKGYCQDIHLESIQEIIEVKDDSSFTNNVSIHFKKSDERRFYPIFYDTELEKVSDIKLFIKKRKREKPIYIKKIYEEDAKLEYITSKKIKYVMIPADKEIKLSYSVSCKELMYFSSLPFFSYNQLDTLNYKIKVPENFELVYNTIYKESIPYYKIDSTKTETSSVWNIKVVPQKVEPDPFQFFGVYKNMRNPLMRIIVTPDSYKNRPTNYINDWYSEKVASKKGLNYQVKQKIDQLTANIKDPSEITNIIYNYVKNNFKYVAIEVGMGAFIPTHANAVYLNKEGDCKDLSNFLSEALRYKGISSDIALAATFDHISDCDFPSLSSANHVIAVAYLNGKVVLLDPTDSIHREGTPVESLQDRNILIVSSKGGVFHNVKSFTPEENTILYQLELKEDKTSINGTFKTTYKGISGNFLRRRIKGKNQKELLDFGNVFYEEIFRNQSISNLELFNDSEKIECKGNVSINSKSFDDGESKYLFIDFLPRIIEIENRETLIEGINLANPFHKKVRAKIRINEPIKDFDPITYDYQEEGIKLSVIIKPVSKSEIECNYDFILSHVYLEKEKVSKINEILKSFKKIINEPIILKKQKS